MSRRRRAHGDLGRRRHRLRSRRTCRARGRRRARPCRPGDGRPGSHRRRAPGGVRARRHGDGAGCRRTIAPLPGVAPVAMQQGRYAARAIRQRLRGRASDPFRYVDKGNLATIGRSKAVADVKGIHLTGFLAWVTLAPRPPLLPDRLPEQTARRPPLDDQLRHPRTRSPADPPPIGADRRRASGQPSPGPRRPCRRPRRAPVDPCRLSDGSTTIGRRTFPRARANKEGRIPT